MSVFIILYAASILAASFILMVRCFDLHRIIQRPNVISILYLFHITAQFIPSLTLLAQPLEYPASESYFHACAIAALTIPLGGLIANWLFPNAKPDTEKNTNIPTNQLVLFFSIIGLIIMGLFLYNAPTSPLYLLIMDNPAHNQLVWLREQINQMGYLYGFARLFFLPFLMVLLLCHWKHYPNWLVKTPVLFIITLIFFYAAYPSTKTHVAMLFVLAVLTWLLTRKKDKEFKWKNYIIPAILLIGIIGYPLFIYLNKPIGQAYDILNIFIHGFLMRIFYKPAVNAYLAFSIIPETLYFTYLKDISKLSTLMGWETYPLAKHIGMIRHYMISSSPPASIGTFYAQAGWPLAIIGPMAAACLFKLIENLLLFTKNRTLVELSLHVMLLYGAFRFSWGYFHTILLTECLFPILLIWLIRQTWPQSKA